MAYVGTQQIEEIERQLIRRGNISGGGGGGGPVAWGDVTGKPTTFPPSTHGHVISDVTGLQTALDGKQPVGSYAPAVHGHAITDVSGLQAALDGKQAAGSYAAEVHGHVVGDVAGLQAALDGRAALSHTHALSDLTASGASAGQVATWNGSEWVPQAPSGGGGGASYAYVQLTANYTLANNNLEQRLFNATPNGALTLATGRYRFNCTLYILSMNATSGNGSFRLLGGGTATLANVIYSAVGTDNTGPLSAGAAARSGSVTSSSAGSMVTAGTGTGLWAQIDGMFNVTAAGTIIPSIALVTAAAAVVQSGSYFECLRIGDTGANTQGSWS